MLGKIWDAHEILRHPSGPALLYIDRDLIHEGSFHAFADLKRRGVAIVYVSHKMSEIFRICDRITVMRDGETIGTLETADATNEDVIRMMVGRDLQYIRLNGTIVGALAGLVIFAIAHAVLV